MGWILTKGLTADEFEERITVFKETFSLEGEITLNTKVVSFGDHIRLVLWSWRGDNVFPDFKIIQDKVKERFVLINGYSDKTNNLILSPAECSAIMNKLDSNNYKFLEEWSGSFSLLYLNIQNSSMQIFTDRIASQQVWYSDSDKKLILSNFPSSTAVFNPEKPRLDPAGLYSLIVTSRHVSDKSIYSNIRNIPGGQYLMSGPENKLVKGKWTNIQYRPNYEVKVDEWAHEISKSLKKSASFIEEAGKKNYLFLSGGMDSRVAAASFNSLETITLGNRPNMNSRTAQKVAENMGFRNELIIRESDWYLKTFRRAALIASGNYKITHAHFIPFIEDRIKEEPCANFLLGDMLENFNKHYFKTDTVNVEKLTTEKLIKDFNRIYSYSHSNIEYIEQIFNPSILKSVREVWQVDIRNRWNEVCEISEFNQDRLDAFFRWYDSSSCPTQLMMECIKPYAGLRNLMYDKDLISVLLKIPHKLKSSGKLHNLILKELNPELLKIINSNFWMSPTSPNFLKIAAKKIRPTLGKVRRKIYKAINKSIAFTEGSWDVLYFRYKQDESYRAFINKAMKIASERDDVFNPVFIKNHWKDFLDGNSTQTYEIELVITFSLLNELIDFKDFQ